MHFLIPAFLALALGVTTLTGDAAAASIEGSWAGGGTVRLKDGGVEKVRCRVKYEPGTGKTFVLYANCAHSNGTFQQSGRVVQRSSSQYTGRLYSEQYSVSGDVSIKVSGSRQTVTAVSPKGSATLTLRKQ